MENHIKNLTNFEIGTTNHGNEAIIHEDFYYIFDKPNAEGAKLFKCRKFKNKCTRRCKLKNNSISIYGTESHHNHEPDTEWIINQRAKLKMKNLMDSNPTRSSKRIYDEIINEEKQILKNHLNEAQITLSLPTFDDIRTSLHQVKRKYFPRQPLSCAELILPNEFITIETKNFLLLNEGTENKIVIFGTENFFSLLCESEIVLMDGTFDVVPKIFSQLYTLHGVYEEKTICFLYCLLVDKKYETYLKLFRSIQDLAIQRNMIFSPKKFQIDFEIAVINSLKLVFPLAEIKGCLFHYSQCIWRKVQNCGLVSAYKNNKEVKDTIKRVSALPFLPINHITDAWINIHSKAPEEQLPKLTEFLDYTSNTWINEEECLFERKMWNHYQNYKMRTTNSVESWHSQLKREALKSHLNIYEFILLLKKQQLKFENEVSLLNIGNGTTPKRLKYKKLDEKIERLTNQYLRTKNDLKFLDAVGYALKLGN